MAGLNLPGMDLKALKGVDLSYFKSLTFRDIQQILLDKKFELAAGGLLICSIFAAVLVMKSGIAESEQLKQDSKALNAKTEPIKQYKSITAEKKAFLESLPPALTEDNFISVLTDIAVKNGVRITNFTSPVASKGPSTLKLTSKFSYDAPNFKKALLFLYAVEKANYAMKLDTLVIRPLKASTGDLDGQGAPDRTVTIETTVSSIKVVEDQPSKSEKKKE